MGARLSSWLHRLQRRESRDIRQPRAAVSLFPSSGASQSFLASSPHSAALSARQLRVLEHIRRGDVARLQRALTGLTGRPKREINEPLGQWRFTYLMQASYLNKLACVRLLVGLGADVNAEDRVDCTHITLSHAHAGLIRVEGDADAFTPSPALGALCCAAQSGHTALLRAAMWGALPVVFWLVRHCDVARLTADDFHEAYASACMARVDVRRCIREAQRERLLERITPLMQREGLPVTDLHRIIVHYAVE